MPVRGQTGAFPPIGGLYQWCTVTHTHTHTYTHVLCTYVIFWHKETEIELLIALEQISKDSRGLFIEGLV